MKRLLFLSLACIVAFMLVACDSGSTGDFQIRLRLPYDDGICRDADEDSDSTYCIQENDQILLSIYSKVDVAEEYVYADRKLIKVANGKSGNEEFVRSLKKGNYYRFFVQVTNKNEKLKLTGGIDGILYDDGDNYEVDIFLAPAGDFARVNADRTHMGTSSLESYFGEDGSKGSAAVTLKDGSIYMAGGLNFDSEEIARDAAVFDMKSLKRNDVKQLPTALYDHIAALLDDGSERGKVVVGLGTMVDPDSEKETPSPSAWIYDPKSNSYEGLVLGAPAMTKAKAITIDGDVYIVGGCTANSAEAAVYKVSAKTGTVVSEVFATLNTGRCNHALADVSVVTATVNAETGEETKTITPRILVIGGSTNFEPEGGETPVTGDNFIELVENGKSTPYAISDRNGSDDSNLKGTGLISPAAVAIIMDDKEEDETAVAVLGGYVREGEDDEFSWETNPRLFVFSEGEAGLVYDANTAPNKCARPSAALLGSEEKSVFKYVAVNCGSEDLERNLKHASDQKVFVLQVKRVKDSETQNEVYSSSVKDTMMNGNKDPESDARIVDGPVAFDGLGQVFMLGGKYVYQVGSYAVPVR